MISRKVTRRAPPRCCAPGLIADLETPVAAYLKLRAAHAGPAFLLESVEGGAVRGRYSMIGLAPDLIWRCHDGACEKNRPRCTVGRERLLRLIRARRWRACAR